MAMIYNMSLTPSDGLYRGEEGSSGKVALPKHTGRVRDAGYG